MCRLPFLPRRAIRGVALWPKSCLCSAWRRLRTIASGGILTSQARDAIRARKLRCCLSTCKCTGVLVWRAFGDILLTRYVARRMGATLCLSSLPVAYPCHPVYVLQKTNALIIGEVHARCAEHMLLAGNAEASVEHWIATIGAVPPSAVIVKLLAPHCELMHAWPAKRSAVRE
eukprot:scaffold9903_cov30-Tisochrysis_lutea.AAC.10